MFKKTITAVLATATIGIGFMLAAPVTANAKDIRGHIGYSHGHGRVELSFGHQPRVYKRKLRHQSVCHPRRAVHKAERRGLRKIRVSRVNHRYVVINGRKHGARVKVGFYRDSPRCKVAWVDRQARHGNFVQPRRHGYRY